MKIKIETIVEIPDDQLFPDIPHDQLPKGALEGQAKQIIFDSITNFATCAHLVKTLEYTNKHKVLAQFHNNWADVCGSLKWKMKRV